MPDIEIAGTKVPAGARRMVVIPATRDVAMPIDIHTHVVAGKKDGPTLLLLSMLHGNEWFSVLILRELLSRLDPGSLSGNVIAVPVANVAACPPGPGSLVAPSDAPDASPPFGGIYYWMTSQIPRGSRRARRSRRR